MDITKGFLDDISRPASSEIKRLSRDCPRSLEVLSPDVTHSEVHSSTHERTDLTAENSSDQGKCERLDGDNIAFMASCLKFHKAKLLSSEDSNQDCDEVDFVPVFETEVLDLKNNMNTRHETEECH
ncbi:fibrous sheath-interacting 1 [Labeo rohita]|uniref:Fibrous sheath-interacting protein 1 n=1 Tax=Labeo rohita TaxID=84645 RepID=A0A498P745_LABRO|nr:fibrous sheath-interacting 1 [Labeo rohita]